MADARHPDEPSKIQSKKVQPTESQPIKTQRLILREASMFDLGAFHELYSSEEVMRYWAKTHVSVSETEKYLRNTLISPNNGHLGFVIVLAPSTSTTASSTLPIATTMDEGIVIGHAGVWHPEVNELVFMIGEKYWGEGYMTEVLATLIPIFWGKGLKEVHADVNPDNVVSLKLLRSLGFKDTGSDIVESYKGYCEQLHLELSNPYAKEDKEAGDGDDDESD